MKSRCCILIFSFQLERFLLLVLSGNLLRFVTGLSSIDVSSGAEGHRSWSKGGDVELQRLGFPAPAPAPGPFGDVMMAPATPYWMVLAAANPKLQALEDRQVGADLSGQDKEAATAANRAMSAETEADAALARVEGLKVLAETKMADLVNMKGEVSLAAEKAANDAAFSEKAVETLTSGVDAATANAQQLAIEQVQGLFKKEFQELKPWRNSVLRDFASDATRASGKAAAPYNNRVNALYKRNGAYQELAKSLNSQAGSLGLAANNLMKNAQLKIGRGDSVGAYDDAKEAKRMQGQARAILQKSRQIQAKVEEVNALIPQYFARGATAAWRAAVAANPDYLPPQPYDAGAAYTPPPSAAGPAPAA